MNVARCLLPLCLSVGALAQKPVAQPEHCREILHDALQDKNPDTRKQAVLALSLAASREPFQSELEAMLQDKDVEVRLATISSLVDLRSKRTAPSLQNALNDDVPEVSFAAAKALWGLHDPAGKEALLSILSGESKASSGFLSKHMREALRISHTPKTMFLFAVTRGVGFAPVPGLGEGISSMQGLLSDPSVSGRATAALLLAHDRDPKTVQALREALSDKDWSVRAAAIHSLALRNDPSAQKDIVPLLEDEKQAVRLRAAAGYLRLQMIREKPASKPVRAPAARK